jgi:predicted naringenin-chalcone synthase
LSAREPKEKGAYLSCTHFGSYLIAEGKEDMKWDIGQQGFEMVLNKNIPAHITQHMRKAYLDFLGKNKLNPSDVRQYAIHPGGKNILRAFAEAIGITASDLPESYAILSHYGNMSSTTLLFVLSQFLSNKGENPDMSLLYAAAFGPGLSVENALLTWQQIP